MKNQKQIKTYIGVDLGDRKHQICVTDKDGNVLEEKSIENTRMDLAELAEDYPEATVGMEVGTHSPWISRYLEAMGLEVFVANPRKLKYISENDRKSDVRDARLLAKFVRLDPEILCPVKHRSEASHEDLVVIRMRDSLVRSRVSIISSVRGVIKSLGVRIPCCGTACFSKRAKEYLSQEHAQLLDSVWPALDALEVMTEQIKACEEKIHTSIVERHKEAVNLQTIPGVGELTALTFILTIEDKERFEDPRDIGAFLGLVPKRRQSGNIDRELRISKAGDKELRRLLVQSAQYLLGQHAPDSALRDWALEYVGRQGKKNKGRAVVAVARKIAVAMMVMWQKGEAYKPYPNGKPEPASLELDKAA